MSKGVGKTLGTFARNLRTHAKRVIGGQESAGDAIADVVDDVKKLGHIVEQTKMSENRKRARKYVAAGRHSYNKKDYTIAEERFRKAINADPLYGFGHLYLGHTLYKLGNQEAAVHEWRKTMTVDPDSDAAEKASRKLRRLDEKLEDAVNHLKNR